MTSRLTGFGILVAGCCFLFMLVMGFVPARETTLSDMALRESVLPQTGHMIVARNGSVFSRALHGFVEMENVPPYSLAEAGNTQERKRQTAPSVSFAPEVFDNEFVDFVADNTFCTDTSAIDPGADRFSLYWNHSRQRAEPSPGMAKSFRKIWNDVQALVGLTEEMRKNAGQYRDIVEKYAEKYHLSPELVYALIHTESRFDPQLISNASAHGLMQVVPKTAGEEVHRWFGHTGIPGRKLLLDPEQNIRYGIASFYLMSTRYLGAVENPLSREYCTIAAYNLGPGRVLKLFGKTREKAVDSINAMTPQQVCAILLQKAPSRQTRAFLAQVLEAKQQFAFLEYGIVPVGGSSSRNNADFSCRLNGIQGN